MRKVLYIIALLLLIPFAACKKEPGKVDLGYLDVTSSEGIRFDYHEGEGHIVVNTSSEVKALLDENDWCSIVEEKTTGNVVYVKAEAHTGLQSRATFITLTADGRERVISITQTAFALTAAKSVDLAWDNGDYHLAVSPADFSLTGSSSVSSSATWLRCEINSEGNVILKPDQNSTARRTATLTITVGEQSTTVTVNQLSPLILTPSSLSFPATASNQVVGYEFKAGTDTGVTVAVPTEHQAWLSATVNSTTKNITVTATATDLLVSRNATITVSSVSGGLDAQISVYQLGRRINASDVYGVYDVVYTSIFDLQDGLDTDGDGYIDTRTTTGVTIRPKTGGGPDDITITGLFSQLSDRLKPMNFDAVIDAENRRITILGNSSVSGGTGEFANGVSVINRNTGNITMIIGGQGSLVSPSGLEWGYQTSSGLIDMIVASGWTRTSTTLPTTP